MLNQQTVRPLPAIFIGQEMLNNRVTRYLTDKHPVLSQQLSGDGPAREDTRSVWYTREHLETLLDEMRHYHADGMRVYFGAYGDNEEGRPAGQLCLLMVMTRPDSSGTQQDIILENEPDFDGRLQGYRSKALNTGGSMGGGPILGGGSILGQNTIPKEYNYGAPCPPICNPKPPTAPGSPH